MGNFFSDLLKGGAEGLAAGLGTFAKDLRTAITGEAPIDPNKRAEILLQTQALEAASEKMAADYATAQMQGQIETNKIEAASPSLFKSGWRPAAGWVCVLGLFYTFLLKPILPWLVDVTCLVLGSESAAPPMPEIPIGELITLLAGLLGLGGMRMYEKRSGVASR